MPVIGRVDESTEHVLSFSFIFGRIGFNNNPAREKVPVDQDAFTSQLQTFVGQEQQNISYNPSIAYYQERIRGLTNYTTLNIVDKLQGAKVLSYNTDTSELRISVREEDYEILSQIQAEVLPRLRAIGRVIKNESTGVQYFTITNLFAIDLVRVDGEALEFLNAAIQTYPTINMFPLPGKSNTVYIDRATNLLYRYDETKSSYAKLGFDETTLKFINGTF